MLSLKQTIQDGIFRMETSQNILSTFSNILHVCILPMFSLPAISLIYLWSPPWYCDAQGSHLGLLYTSRSGDPPYSINVLCLSICINHDIKRYLIVGKRNRVGYRVAKKDRITFYRQGQLVTRLDLLLSVSKRKTADLLIWLTAQLYLSSHKYKK